MNIFNENNWDDNLNDAHVESPAPEETVATLRIALEDAKQEAKGNWEALQLLTKICKERGFDPFAGQSAPLALKPCDMKREDLVNRNQEATARIEKNRHVTSPDQIPMPTYEEEAKLYKENTDKGSYVNTVLELMEKSKIAEKARIEAKAPKRPSVEMIFASCKNPYDPYAE